VADPRASPSASNRTVAAAHERSTLVQRMAGAFPGARMAAMGRAARQTSNQSPWGKRKLCPQSSLPRHLRYGSGHGPLPPDGGVSADLIQAYASSIHLSPGACAAFPTYRAWPSSPRPSG
jgi:hypothetical protein